MRAHLLISGRVQGVWYRASARNEAFRLKIKGWVRNLPDGKVEAAFEGPTKAVEEVVAWCYKGPPAARVDNVELTWEKPQGETEFSMR
ncbi:Acylphosphatase [uncultured archaeon]|nr:Acylphosphatase [uncultured archaeon]